MLDHALEMPPHPICARGLGVSPSPSGNHVGTHMHQVGHGVGITLRKDCHQINGSFGIPSLAPLTHCLDLTGLLVPDAVCKGYDPRSDPIQDVSTHEQSSGVVLDNGTAEA